MAHSIAGFSASPSWRKRIQVFTNAGLAVGQPQEIGSRDIGEGTKYGFGIR